jgi:hypothetical protein
MYLVNTRTGDMVMLAKYYPSTGWSIWERLDFKGIDDLFIETYRGHVEDGEEWEIMYEVRDDALAFEPGEVK